MRYLFLVATLLVSLSIHAQFQVRDSSLFNPHFAVSYGVHFPSGDMADRFGINQSLGLGFHIKSKTNWYYGIQANYIFGKDVTEPNLIQNLLTADGELLDNQGQITNLFIQQRGFAVTANGGKLINTKRVNPNSGFLLLGGVGFLQHKIRLEHQETYVKQLDGEYEKGYDRLTNGLTLYQFAGYFFMSNNRLINMYGGIEAYQAFTQNRRDLNFDTMTRDTARRKDILVGFRLGWVLNLYRRSPDKFYYN
jgi:hypothetical protein